MDPFVGEIRLFACSYAPRGWALCNGQQISISQNTALYALLGTLYGGDGRSTFNLPNLQGLVAIGQGQGTGLQNYPIGAQGGATTVTLNTSQMPAHTHTLAATSAAGTSLTASGNVLAQSDIPGGRGKPSTNGMMYASASSQTTPMSSNSLTQSGGNAAHNNLQPYVTLTYCIALTGIFPTRQ